MRYERRQDYHEIYSAEQYVLIIVQTTRSISQTILAAAGLSYIGLGVQSPTPEWGAMLTLPENICVHILTLWYFRGLHW